MRPEQGSNLRPTAEEANPNQARQRPPWPYVALTCNNNNRLTPPDAARLLLTLALSLAPHESVIEKGEVDPPLPQQNWHGNYLEAARACCRELPCSRLGSAGPLAYPASSPSSRLTRARSVWRKSFPTHSSFSPAMEAVA